MQKLFFYWKFMQSKENVKNINLKKIKSVQMYTKSKYTKNMQTYAEGCKT